MAGHDLGRGAVWIPANAKSKAIVETAAAQLGVAAYGVDKAPAGKLIALKPPRIALADVYGGSMPSGWNRWLLEQFEFPYTVVYPQRLDAGDLRKDFDVLLLPDSIGISSHGTKPQRRGPGQPKPEDIPAQYRPWLGSITVDRTSPQIAAFLKAGGSVVAVGESTGVAEMLNLPSMRLAVTALVAVSDPLTETADGKTRPLSSTKFYIPGSVVRVQVDQANPLAFGVTPQVALFFDSSPVFRVADGAKGVSTVAAFRGEDPLMSGWALGQKRLDGAAAIVDACVGRGHVFLMGPEVNQRAQSHAAFKFLFNGLYLSAADGNAKSCL